MSERKHILMPTEVDSRIGFFDRFAGWASLVASRAPFFAFCILLVVVWLAQGIVVVLATGKFSSFLSSTYQLEINTTTTIITFLMVALLQNSATRSDQAVQHKLNAIADALADLMEHLDSGQPGGRLACDVSELKAAIGLEERETTSGDSQPKRSPALQGTEA